MRLQWTLLKVVIATGILVAALAGTQAGATVSAHGKAKGNPSSGVSGPQGQPFIITFD